MTLQTGRSPHERWDNSQGAVDFLHLVGQGGAFLGGIDANGNLQGSLASTAASSVRPTDNATYVSTSCPSPNPGNCFQVFADVQDALDAIYANGSPTVTTGAGDPPFSCPNGVFPCSSGGDVGKIAFGAGRCTGDVSRCFYDVPQGTIVTVNNAHSVTLSTTATNSSSGNPKSNNFFWGHDDGMQLAAAFASLFITNGINPNRALLLPCGTMFTSVPPFVAPSDNNGGGLIGCGGSGGTVVIPLPKMNCNSVDSAGCLFSNTTTNQIANGLNLFGWTVRDISFWGGGTDVKDAAATCNGNAGIVTSFYDTLINVSVVGFRWSGGCMNFGMSGNGSTWYTCNSVAAGASTATMSGTSGAVGTVIGGTYGGIGAGNNACFAVGSGQVNTEGVYFNQNFGAGGVNAGTVVNGSGIWSDHGSNVTGDFVSKTGGTSYLHGTTLNQFGGGNSVLTQPGGIVHLNGVQFVASGAPINQTGGTLYDDGGNGILPASTPTISNLFGDGSITGIADVAGNHVLTSGWGTANVNTVGGSVKDVQFTISVTAGAPAASPVLTDTFATPFWASPRAGCYLLQVGGSVGDISNPAVSSLSRTGITWTFTGTPVVGHSYTFVRHCAN